MGFRQNPSLLWLWSSFHNLKFLPSQGRWVEGRPEAPELRELMPKFKVFMVHLKKTVIFVHTFWRSTYICTNIMYTIWINFEFSSNYSYLYSTHHGTDYMQVKWLPGPANRANHLGIWLSTFQPLPTLGGNSGLDPGIYNHFWIHRIHLCIKYSITI